MRPRHSLIILLFWAAACAAWLWSIDPRTRFTTDVGELLPAHERDPDAQLALSLTRERQARVVLAVLDAPADTSASALASAADDFVATLRASPAFADAELIGHSASRQKLGALLHARRFDLLLPGWLADQRAAFATAPSSSLSLHPSSLSPHPSSFPDWLAARAVATLDARLASPKGAVGAELLASDPLLLLPELAERADTLASAPTPSAGRALVWAESAAAPLSEEGQAPVFAALDAATRAARVHVPALEVRDTGVARFAFAAKTSTRAEITRLNLFAILAVLTVTALLVRRLVGLLHLLPLVLLATASATAVTTAIFPRVHVLVFVLGALLSGVAVDYAFHVLLARREGESYGGRARRIALPLLGGAGTTIGGFLILTFSELPLVKQLGVYVAAGAAAGLGLTLLYLHLFPRLDLSPRVWRLPAPSSGGRGRRALVVALLAGLAVFGLARVHWRDDLRDLEYPSPALRANDAAIRALFGETDSGATYLTRGDTLAEARARWADFYAAAPSDARPASSALLLPEAADYAATHDAETRKNLAAFVSAFRAEAEKAGFEPEAFAPFFTDFATWLAAPVPDYEALARDTLAALPGPLGLLAHVDDDGAWFISTTPRAVPVPAGQSGTRSLSGIQSLNDLFARFRAETLRLSLLGAAALVLIACALHGPRRGLRTAALPLLATASALGLLALRGEDFGLFHLLGALLGICLADDYAHFAHVGSDADTGGAASHAGIRLSALTTAASFAVLTASAIPAVSALGATVALIVLLALVFVETDLFSLRAPATEPQ